MGQMACGLRGGLWPTSFPLFQAPRLLMVSMTDSLFVDRSHIVRSVREWLLWGRMLYAGYRPVGVIRPLKLSGRSRLSTDGQISVATGKSVPFGD